MAPRPIKMMTAIRDFFPIEGARATFAEAQRVFEAAGGRDKVDLFEYDDGHGWSKPRREATYRWFEKNLNGREDEGIEPEIAVEPAASLNVTATGQLATSGGSETVSTLNAKLAAEMHSRRTAANGGDVPALIRKRLRIEESVTSATARRVGEVGRDGYRVERLLIEGERPLAALAFVPAAGDQAKPAVLWLHANGKSVDAAPNGDIEGAVRAGYFVLAVDLSGWGETAKAPAQAGGYTNSYQTYMRGFLVGRYLPGLLVSDALRALVYLRSRSGVDAARISILGKGNGGVVALYAAAIDRKVSKIAAERSVTSYLGIAKSPTHEGVLDIVVPGVLADFDLPDVAKSIAPRAVWLVDPRGANGNPAAADEYSRSGAVLRQRPEGWSFSKVYADWLRL
jgi:pimeloyl-ACP methyl ester carboxylesterase